MSERLFPTASRAYNLIKSDTPGFPLRTTSSHNGSTHIARLQASHCSTRTSKPCPPTPSTIPIQPAVPHKNPSLPSFNLFHEVRNARPAVRYTVYAGLGLMATVESTFWFNVIKAKFFPSDSRAENDSAEEFLARVRDAMAGYKATWMANYGRYYGGYVWGVGER